MKSSDIAFLTDQLAEMLKAGTPLPGALRQLADDGIDGRRSEELRRLESDLADGRPVSEAFERSQFPRFVKSMVAIGAAGGDLPGTLRSVADYYRRRSELQLRMSGLLVYPFLVLLCMLVFCLTMATLMVPHIERMFAEASTGVGVPLEVSSAGAWIMTAVVGGLVVGSVLLLALPELRGPFSWKCPPFRSRNIAELASMLAVCLRGGMPLRDALGLLAQMESARVKSEMKRLEKQLANGKSEAETLAGTSLLPPLAGWMISTSGRDLPDGLEAVADLYRRRSAGQTDVFLYALLPAATIMLGALMLQVYMIPIRHLMKLLDLLSFCP